MGLQRAIYAQAVLFLLVVFAGLGFIVARFAPPAGREPFAAMGRAQLVDGRVTKKIDDGVVDALPSSEALDGLQAGLEYRIFDDAGPQVRAGCPNWLFLTEEVVEVKGGDANMALHLALARKIVATFAQHGLGLVVLVAPDKARMASAELCRQRVSPQSRARLARWWRMTADLPVAQVDVVPGWPGRPGYWHTDTHWDRVGAAYAASRTAIAVARLLAAPGTQRASVQRGAAPEPRPGDLLHLSNLQNAPPALRPLPDMDVPESVTWENTGGLLASGPPPDVVLAGSSYSRNSGFSDRLGLDLHREVVQMSQDGGGFAGAVLALLQEHPDLLRRAKVVVWEFPERSLTQPLNDAERAYLGTGR